MAVLTGALTPVALGDGFRLTAPGFRGTAEMRRPLPGDVRARGGQDTTEALARAFEATGISTARDIGLKVQPIAGSPEHRLRSPGGADAIELVIPSAGAEFRHLVLVCDEGGALTWHLPAAAESSAAATRGGEPEIRFIIPVQTPPPAAPGQTRSLVSAAGRKLLKVLVYPVMDPVVGAVSDAFAERWEERNRPYGLCDFTPATTTAGDGRAFEPADWTRLSEGDALLFIHGTFSTAHSAFSQLSRATLDALCARYQGRVFAFNHYTLSHDPVQNVRWLLAQVPPAIRLSLDVICHSRGGLVARTLAEQPSAFGIEAPNVSVRRVVFVAVPNQGTLLANPDHMVQMIDRITSALNVFPTDAVSETLEALLTTLKVVGHGALNGLPGLLAMRPDGEFIGALNHGAPRPVEYFAAAADFRAAGHGLNALVAGAANHAMDIVFENDPNDLVVPESGVYGANGCQAFPVDPSRLLLLPESAAVTHTTMFGCSDVSARIEQWLTAAG
jgi:hypothetical protein